RAGAQNGWAAGKTTAMQRTTRTLAVAMRRGQMVTKVLIVDTTLHLGHPLLSYRSSRSDLEVRFFDERPFIESLQRSRVNKVLYRMLGRRPVSAWPLNARLLDEALKYRPDV